MSRITKPISRAGLLALSLLPALALAGCSSDRLARTGSDITNTVLRPIYGQGEEKTVYLGGYAGANYKDGGR